MTTATRTADTTPDDQLVPYTAIYAGRRIGRDRKVQYSFLDERDGLFYTYARQVIPGATIGARYAVHETPAGSLRVSGTGAPAYIDSLDRDDPRVVDWRATDLTVEDDRQRASAIRKAGDPFAEVEDLLRMAAQTLSKTQRRALAARLMEVLYL